MYEVVIRADVIDDSGIGGGGGGRGEQQLHSRGLAAAASAVVGIAAGVRFFCRRYTSSYRGGMAAR